MYFSGYWIISVLVSTDSCYIKQCHISVPESVSVRESKVYFREWERARCDVIPVMCWNPSYNQDRVLTLRPDNSLRQAGGCRNGFGRGEEERGFVEMEKFGLIFLLKWNELKWYFFVLNKYQKKVPLGTGAEFHLPVQVQILSGTQDDNPLELKAVFNGINSYIFKRVILWEGGI